MNKKYHVSPGDRFNRLVCLSFHHVGNHHRSYFVFRCDCGKEKIILGSGVVSGNTKSCGCLSAEVKKQKILPNNAGVIYQIILGYKRHANRRGLKWLLSITDVRNIIDKPCYYCGAINSNKKITKSKKEGFLYNGIDRKDNKQHYTIDNSLPCCKQCNRAKGDMSFDKFIAWIKAMADQWG